MSRIGISSGSMAVLVATGCATADMVSAAPDEAALLALNEQLFRSAIIENQTAELDAHSVPSLTVLAPGGMVENKAAVLAGVAAFDAADLTLSGQSVAYHGDIATVTGRIDIDGEMRPVGRFGPLKFMSTYVQEDRGWKLVSRSLTPCLPKLIEVGRC